MTARVVVLASPKPDMAEGAAKYAAGVQPLLAAAGVKPAFRGPVAETIAGSSPPATIMVLDFPDAQAATDFFAQDAYQALVPLRDESFARMDIYVV